MGGGGCDLVALTAFYEQHYVCFCFSHTAGQWIHYDDDTRRLIWSKWQGWRLPAAGAGCLKHACRRASVGPWRALQLPESKCHIWIPRRLLGKDFDSVKEKCIAGRLHPQLLFYESR